MHIYISVIHVCHHVDTLILNILSRSAREWRRMAPDRPSLFLQKMAIDLTEARRPETGPLSWLFLGQEADVWLLSGLF